MKGKKLEFLIVDPQNDFCDPNGALYVPGAVEDSKRLAETIKRLRNKISHISVTLDTHRLVDIAHPIFWVDSKGRHPEPFTHHQGRSEEGCGGPRSRIIWREPYAMWTNWQNDRYVLCIWPPHCLIGSCKLRDKACLRRPP